VKIIPKSAFGKVQEENQGGLLHVSQVHLKMAAKMLDVSKHTTTTLV